MKTIILLSLLITFSCHALTPKETERYVNAIYVIEGGNKTKYPYGIKSIKTNNPRKVCINTVNNNFARWVKAGRPMTFIEYLGNVYCPPSADPKGNINWKRNLKKLLDFSN